MKRHTLILRLTRAFIIFFVVVSLMNGCGGGGSSNPGGGTTGAGAGTGGGGSPADTTPPTVSSVTPTNGAMEVVINSTISVVFSEAMNASSVNTSTFVVKFGANSVAGSVSYSGNTATFTPAALLAGDSNYTVTITSGAKDVAGNALAANFTSTFKTAAELVGFREDTGNQFAARYNADAPGDPPLDVVTGAKYAATLAGNAGVVYQVPATSPHTEIGLYTSGGTHLVVAAATGHTYNYLGATATGRWVYWDLATTGYDIHSRDLSGGDDRTLVSGCSSATVPLVRVSAKGVIVVCTEGSNAPAWASDGLAAATNIPGTQLTDVPLDYFPEGVLFNRGGVIYHAPADGSATPLILSPDGANSTGDIYFSGVIGTGDTILISSHVATTPAYHLWPMGADGTSRYIVPKKSGSPASGLVSVSPDDRYFVVQLPDDLTTTNSVVYRFSFTDSNDALSFTPNGTNDAEGHFLPDGAVVVKGASGTNPWRLYAPNTASSPATLTGVGAFSAFLGASGIWMLFNDQTSPITALTSISEDLMTQHTISNALANSPHFIWGTSGADFGYLDKNGMAHVGTPDASRAAVLDSAPSVTLQPSGITPEGREFWIVTHAAGDKDTISLDPSGTVTKIMGGSTSDAGWFVP